MSIVDFFMDQRQVDSIKLSILLEHLAAELDTARKAALETNTREQWDAEVLPRLTFSLEETLGRIDLTQRAMDEQQNQVKTEIAALLTQNWVDAIHSCENCCTRPARPCASCKIPWTPPATACRRGC